MENIGRLIKHYREQLRLSQSDLSERSNVSQASIARIESGNQRNLKRETMEKLADGLGISLTKLMEPSIMVKEEEVAYSTIRTVPVVRMKDIETMGDFNILLKKADTFKPSLSPDKGAFYLEVTADLTGGPVIEEGDMILIEPSAEVKEGDIVLYLSKEKKSLGKIFYHFNNILIQPLRQDMPPIMSTKAEKKRCGIRILRVSEIKK